MTGVQLIGRKEVLQRFESLQRDNWALFQGKQFIISGEGSAELDSWLKGFEASGSTASYTLRVYDSGEPVTSANAGCDYIANIVFKIVDMYEGYGIGGHGNKLLERLGAIEQQLQGKDPDEEDTPGLGEVVMGWLTDPIKLGQVAGAIRTIMSGAAAPIALPAAVGGQSIGSVNPDNDEVRLQKLAAALDTLEKKDPKLVEHLEKLAQLATSDPALFTGVISKLDLL